MWIRAMYDIVQATQESKAMYVLALLCVAMIIDIITGTIAAKINKEIKSGVGINGLMRKASSIIVLMFCAFLVPLIPYAAGIAALYAFYLAYLGFEMKSIIENLQKMGLFVKPLQAFVEATTGTAAETTKDGEENDNDN